MTDLAAHECRVRSAVLLLNEVILAAEEAGLTVRLDRVRRYGPPIIRGFAVIEGSRTAAQREAARVRARREAGMVRARRAGAPMGARA